LIRKAKIQLFILLHNDRAIKLGIGEEALDVEYFGVLVLVHLNELASVEITCRVAVEVNVAAGFESLFEAFPVLSNYRDYRDLRGLMFSFLNYGLTFHDDVWEAFDFTLLMNC